MSDLHGNSSFQTEVGTNNFSITGSPTRTQELLNPGPGLIDVRSANHESKHEGPEEGSWDVARDSVGMNCFSLTESWKKKQNNNNNNNNNNNRQQ